MSFFILLTSFVFRYVNQQSSDQIKNSKLNNTVNYVIFHTTYFLCFQVCQLTVKWSNQKFKIKQYSKLHVIFHTTYFLCFQVCQLTVRWSNQKFKIKQYSKFHVIFHATYLLCFQMSIVKWSNQKFKIKQYSKLHVIFHTTYSLCFQVRPLTVKWSN